MQFSKVNETARLEWLDSKHLTFRFEYSNHFYGSCTFVAKLVRQRNRFILDGGSLSTETLETKRGSSPGLLNLSTIFLNQLLHTTLFPEALDSQTKIP